MRIDVCMGMAVDMCWCVPCTVGMCTGTPLSGAEDMALGNADLGETKSFPTTFVFGHKPINAAIVVITLFVVRCRQPRAQHCHCRPHRRRCNVTSAM